MNSFSGHNGWRFTKFLLLICILSVGLQAQKIKVEYDKNLDFSKFKTFAWGPLDAVARPLLATAIQGAIEEELTKRGLHKVQSNPDIFMEMYGSVDSDMSISYANPLYSGMGGVPSFDAGFVMWGYGGGTTAVTVHKGQLVVDIIDGSQKKLAWRGIATENLSDNKEKLVGQVNKAVEKMFKRYPAVR
jgi:Domain of unknown function (DUF4136)